MHGRASRSHVCVFGRACRYRSVVTNIVITVIGITIIVTLVCRWRQFFTGSNRSAFYTHVKTHTREKKKKHIPQNENGDDENRSRIRYVIVRVIMFPCPRYFINSIAFLHFFFFSYLSTLGRDRPSAVTA